MKSSLDKYPRVLIIAAEPFNMERGCGITLSNLFEDWPIEKLMSVYWGNVIPDYSVCAAQYKLELSLLALLNILTAKKFMSGLKQPSVSHSFPVHEINKHRCVRNALINLDRKIGISYLLRTIKVHKEVKESIKSFNPQILYCVLSRGNAISVINQVVKIADTPFAVHIFDDWINDKSHSSLVEALLHPVVEARFKKLNRKANIRMAIGDYMCREYESRYRNQYVPFQNAPDPEIWLENGNYTYNSATESFCFRFTGNIYNGGNLQALLHFSDAVEKLALSSKRVSFEIYTTIDTIKLYSGLFARNSCTKILPTVLGLREMASLCGSCDGSVIVCNFDESGTKMLGMSMPTKLPTSMLSGVPLFVYAPADTAMADFIASNNVGYVVSDSLSISDLALHIEKFINDINFRESSALRARKLALDRFTSAIVRPQFRDTLMNISKNDTTPQFGNKQERTL